MTNAYTLKNITVNVQHKCVLNITELNIPAQKCIALLGANGAGKSTLLHLLAFTHQQQSKGDISLFDQKITQSLSPEQRRKIAFVAQHPYLLPGSVEDNIKLSLTLQGIAKSQHRSLIDSALEQTNTTHLASQTATSLSGGELKRVAIARAIAYQADILLLDEPFSHLDSRHIQTIETLLKHYAQQTNKTVIFSTHDRLQGMTIAEETMNLVEGIITKSSLLNVFHGTLKQQRFFTDKLSIITKNAPTQHQAHHIAIDPQQIIISTHVPKSSNTYNNFKGRLILIAEDVETIRLTVDCGEQFHVTISPESLQQLELAVGNTVYLSFKSTAVTVF